MEANNVKAMYEALLKVKKLFDGRIMFQQDIRKAHKAVNAALAEPPRNCDIGTASDMAQRFNQFCQEHRNLYKCCDDCPLLRRGGPCEFEWARMPYKKGETDEQK